MEAEDLHTALKFWCKMLIDDVHLVVRERWQARNST